MLSIVKPKRWWAPAAGLVAVGALAACASDPRPAAAIPAGSPSPLFVDCRGTAGTAPTVILEAGAFGTSADWDSVLNDLAHDGRACAYDRSGLGRSPPAGEEVDVISRAREIGLLLDQIGERRPVILVGHSNGALYVQAFARLYPQRTAGLVYVNGVGTDDLAFPRLVGELNDERRNSRLAASLGEAGLAGVVAHQLVVPGLSPEAEARKRAGLLCVACLEVARDEDIAIVSGLHAVAALPTVERAIPTVSVTGAIEPPDWAEARDWGEAEAAPARRAQHGWILYAQGASHVSPLTRDRAWIDAAVTWLRAPYRSP